AADAVVPRCDHDIGACAVSDFPLERLSDQISRAPLPEHELVEEGAFGLPTHGQEVVSSGDDLPEAFRYRGEQICEAAGLRPPELVRIIVDHPVRPVLNGREPGHLGYAPALVVPPSFYA